MASRFAAYSVGDPVDVVSEGIHYVPNARPTAVLLMTDPAGYTLLAAKPRSDVRGLHPEPIQGGLDEVMQFHSVGFSAPYRAALEGVRRESFEETYHFPAPEAIRPGDFTNLLFGGKQRDGARQKLYLPFHIALPSRRVIGFPASRDNKDAQQIWASPDDLARLVGNAKGPWMRDQLLWLSTQ